MKKIFNVVAFLCLALSANAQIEHPKLIVGLVVDQMRWDYLYYYNTKYGEGGLKRILNEGFSCENTMINYIPTVTAVGHCSIYTGSTPSLNGIAGNYFGINDKSVYCCEDENVKSVGSDGKDGMMSPHRMLATTIGDVLKISTDFKSKVIGVALKDRAAILPAGHSANAAYWWDTANGHFVTSSYYMNELPQWVKNFNKEYNTKPKFNIKTSNLGVDYTFQMAKAALKNEQLGKHDVTDMLTVSISSTDAIGHAFSTRGKENYEVYMELDKDLKDFLDYLDTEVGKGNYLLFLTADHGAVHNYNFMKEHKIPGGGWDYDKSTKDLNTYLQSTIGISPVMSEDNYQFYFNDSVITANGKKKQDVIDAAIDYLNKDSNFLYVVDNEHAAVAAIPNMIKEQIINGYNRQRSGEITVIPRAGVFGVYKPNDNYKGTSHGEWNPYDAHIPCVFMGWHVKHGATNARTHITDIAPTVCAMLHIQMPNSCIGTSIKEVTDN